MRYVLVTMLCCRRKQVIKPNMLQPSTQHERGAAKMRVKCPAVVFSTVEIASGSLFISLRTLFLHRYHFAMPLAPEPHSLLLHSAYCNPIEESSVGFWGLAASGRLIEGFVVFEVRDLKESRTSVGACRSRTRCNASWSISQPLASISVLCGVAEEVLLRFNMCKLVWARKRSKLAERAGQNVIHFKEAQSFGSGRVAFPFQISARLGPRLARRAD